MSIQNLKIAFLQATFFIDRKAENCEVSRSTNVVFKGYHRTESHGLHGRKCERPI
jgi:hypothetical protein